MNQMSISFRLGKPSAPHGANLAHNNREFSASNIMPERTCENIQFQRERLEDAYAALFSEALEAYNAKQNRPCRRIHDYCQHVKDSHREEPYYEVIVQFGDCTNAPCGSAAGDAARQMLIEYMNGFQQRNPNLHIFNAVLHMDEASPHLHIDFIPFYTKGRQKGLSKGVSMKAALIEMGFAARNKYDSSVIGWEKSERVVMEQILIQHGFQREDKQAHYAHMTVDEYKRTQDRKRMTELLRRSQKIEPASVVPNLKQQIAELSAQTTRLQREKESPYRTFYYSDASKLSFVLDQLANRKIPFHETDHGFEAQLCYVDEIRRIEKSYRSPASTIRERLRDDIDLTMYQSTDFDMFLEKLQAKGFAVKTGQHLSVMPPYGERYIRLKSLGEYYDELSIRKRLASKMRFEERLDTAIKERSTVKASSVLVLKETRYYIQVFSQGLLPMRRKKQALPFSWVNDAELDKLLSLNQLLNEGMTPESIRQKAEMLEKEAQSKYEQVETVEKDLKFFLELKEKIGIVFEGKSSEQFTTEQAKATVSQYPDINAGNYRRIDYLIKAGEEKLQKASEVHGQIRDELKQITDSLSIMESVRNHTYVNSLIETEKRIRQTEGKLYDEEKTNEHENYSSM
ncbi:MAG: plasmid recombination protein [Oscillospiraceae bacterium]|nr:plasmid recombination protein [Oscillospiraceae bacterium]